MCNRFANNHPFYYVFETSQDLNTVTDAIDTPEAAIITKEPHLPIYRRYKWWLLVALYTVFLLVGNSTGTLLGRFYFSNDGNSKWLATLLQSAGFSILLPFFLLFPSANTRTSPSVCTLIFLYILFALLVSGDNLMYSYWLLYLPVSTFSLLCSSQLAFNVLFAVFLNSLKLTPYIVNSVVLLAISGILLAISSDSSGSISKENYVIGFLPLWGRRGLEGEMEEFGSGKVSYVMTLVCIALSWQLVSLGALGLIYEVSSLFSNVISTVSLPVVPILAVIFFHDKMDGVKVVAMALSIWGFVSYVYQHYLDGAKLM
ncbi:hypothetical protein GIB67_015404 [Kingdonia uniflora]|uniref:Probable purine permease n=1 Tax=Kingdonia uniflora TaxID=39325 RepID=A0A7J7KYU3_9MAGN|nr:hypothetical protein GIB67_015404 [Kingdonia uniflora]